MLALEPDTGSPIEVGDYRPAPGDRPGSNRIGDEMDFSRLTTAHKIGLGGAIVLLVASFLPWYSVGAAGFTFSLNGWNAGFWAWFGILLGLGGGVVLGLKAFGTQDVRAGGLAAEQIALVLGALSVVFILLRMITAMDGVAFGLFLGLIGAAAVAYGSYQAMTDAGLTVDDMKRGMGGGGTGGGTAGPDDRPGAGGPPPAT